MDGGDVVGHFLGWILFCVAQKGKKRQDLFAHEGLLTIGRGLAVVACSERTTYV